MQRVESERERLEFRVYLKHMSILWTPYMLYGKDTLTMNEVRAAMNSKELPRKLDGKESNGDSLYIGRKEKHQEGKRKV